MINSLKVLAVIPARGGSKRIPNKNIKELAGKPLIAYTTEEAKKSRYIDRLITSTDSEKIANVALKLGSEVPFVRPAELSGDQVTDFPVFLHAFEEMKKMDFEADIIVQLRPTSPLRTSAQIDKAIELLAAHPEVDSVRTVAVPEQSPYKMYVINEEGVLAPILSLEGKRESFNLPTQELPLAYKHVGYLDVVWKKTITEKKSMTGDRILPLILEKAYSGINSHEDWDRYEFIISHSQ